MLNVVIQDTVLKGTGLRHILKRFIKTEQGHKVYIVDCAEWKMNSLSAVVTYADQDLLWTYNTKQIMSSKDLLFLCVIYENVTFRCKRSRFLTVSHLIDTITTENKFKTKSVWRLFCLKKLTKFPNSILLVLRGMCLKHHILF